MFVEKCFFFFSGKISYVIGGWKNYTRCIVIRIIWYSIEDIIETLRYIVIAGAHLQAELFILRLSRNSGVLGLAGMAFISQLFSTDPDFNGETSDYHGTLLVRPLLEFSKEDLYKVSHVHLYSYLCQRSFI